MRQFFATSLFAISLVPLAIGLAFLFIVWVLLCGAVLAEEGGEREGFVTDLLGRFIFGD
jgi:hypothetical protein